MPSGQIHGACQDHSGRVWLAGPSGLVGLDGARVQVLGRAQGLRTQGLRTVACAPDGAVWIGSDLGVDRLDTAGAVTPLSGDDWAFGWVAQIVFGAGEEVWLGCANGLVRWTPQGGFEAQALPGTGVQTVGAVTRDSRGRLWVAGPQLGLLVQDAGTFRLPDFPGWPAAGTIRCLSPGPDGGLLIGSSTGLWLLSERGDVQEIGDVPPGPVTALLWAAPELWVGRPAGLQRLAVAGGGLRPDGDLLPGVAVNSLMLGALGTLWVSTDQVGVARISGLRSCLSLSAPGSGVLALRSAAQEQRVWLGSGRGGWQLDLQSGEAEELAGLEGLQVWDLLEWNGELWAATGQGLYHRRAGTFAPYRPPAASAPAQPCRALLIRAGRLWIGTIHGLYELDIAGGLREVLGGGVSLGYVYTLEHGPADVGVLVGTLGRGLWHEDPQRPGELRPERRGALAHGTHVYALAPHLDGRLAVLQDQRTLLLGPEGQVTVLDEAAQGVAGWAARWVGDQLWVGTSSGLREYGPDGRLRRELSAWLGLDAWEFTTSRSLLPLADGRLLCGVNGGMVALEPQAVRALPPLPPVQLAGVEWSGARPDRASPGVYGIAPGRWGVVALLACPWFIDQDDLCYRHRLLGFERDWSPWSPQASVHFTSLPPGEYTLEVQVGSRLLGLPAEGQAVERVLTLRVRRPTPGSRLAQSWSSLVSARANRQLLERTLQLEQSVRERTLEVEGANLKLRQLNEELQALSSTDPLTGLANRRAFDDTLRRELRRAARDATPLSLVLVDVDEFKRYNDELGHQQGDLCLRGVAGVLRGAVRADVDLVARYGGEEFVLVLPHTDGDGAVRLLRRLQGALEDAAIAHPASSVSCSVTVSAGVGSLIPPRGLSPAQTLTAADTLLRQADIALYQAKASGRNRAVVYRAALDSRSAAGLPG
ncbi:hypothetical protein CVO96_13615 [Deinococcus koreensis]|uniref:GGDEF domain-containing protein n=1 Tax=Deinococcus koreensis TaxID=2054903 RepID=A0A2K3V0F0_9DEIO|nr:hypothetical protein CVO96_13615 [Deinococcus koreensis]